MDSHEQEINLLELVYVVVRHKMFIVKVCCSVVLAVVLYSLTLPNIFSATAKVLPPQKEGGGGLSSLLGQAGGLAAFALGGIGGGSDLYIGILKSRSVADAVVQRLDLKKVYEVETVEASRKKLETEVKFQSGKDGIISIVANDKDPKRAAQIANAFVEELGKVTVRLNLTKAGTERAFLEKRLELVRQDLRTAEESLKDYAQAKGLVQVDSQAKASIEGIARLKTELANREVQLAIVSSKQTDQSPEVKAIRAAISRIKGEIDTLSVGRGDSEAIPSLANVPGMGLEYSRKIRELKVQEAMFEQLTKQHELAKLSEAKDSSAIQVLDLAVAPVYKSAPKRWQLVALGGVVGLVFSMLYIFMSEYLRRLPANDQKLLETIKQQLFTIK